MTIAFIPGEVNQSRDSISQAQWRNHNIIAYGSGNNLIITSTTHKGGLTSKNLQTIYLESDPSCVDINAECGWIAIGRGNKIQVYKPANEYMSAAQWEPCLEFAVSDSVNCIQWASHENELVVGTSNGIHLFHVFSDDFGSFKSLQRWFSTSSAPIDQIRITASANKIVTCGKFDRLGKVWSRINYGDDNTLFEMSYLNHPKDSFLTDLYVRSCAHPKKEIQPFMLFQEHDDYSDIIYTVTNDMQVRVWASYEFNGHSHIRCWASHNLLEEFSRDSIAGIFVIENKQLFTGAVPGSPEDYDLIVVMFRDGSYVLFQVINISISPPNNIKFVEMARGRFGHYAFPSHLPSGELSDDVSFDSAKFWVDYLQPVYVTRPVAYLDKLIILLHDRSKHTIRCDLFGSLELSKLRSRASKKFLKPNDANGSQINNLSEALSSVKTNETLDSIKTTETNESVKATKVSEPVISSPEKPIKIKTDEPFPDPKDFKFTLLNKYQGHTKSIRRLVKSTRGTVLLSVSNFGKHNYIWKPFHINKDKDILLNKICIVNTGVQVKGKTENGTSVVNGNANNIPVLASPILNSVVLEEPQSPESAPLVIALTTSEIAVFDTSTYVATKLDCIARTSDCEANALVVQKVDDHHLVTAVFEDCISTWKISSSNKLSTLSNSLSLPPYVQVNTFENLISFIDKVGKFTVYAVGADLKWEKQYELDTYASSASQLQFTRHKVAIVDKLGYSLVIWDMNSGTLEYEEEFTKENGPIKYLKWNFLEGDNCILSVAFKNFIFQYIQLRYDYTNRIPNFARIKQLDLSHFTSHEIGGIAWIDGFMVMGCGNQFFINDKWVELGQEKGSFIDSTIRQLMVGYAQKYMNDRHEDSDDGGGYRTLKREMSFDINYLVRVLNGPLPVYHPQFLIQCLFMNQLEMVQEILVRLFHTLREGGDIVWNLHMDIDSKIMNASLAKASFVTDSSESKAFKIEIFDKFSSELADLLVDKLHKVTLPLITRHQQSTLISAVYIVEQLLKYVNLLDENAVRFLIGFKLFQMSSKQQHLTMRDINWAVHSDNRDMLIAIVEETYGVHKLRWEHIKNLGMMYWVDTPKLVQLIERICQNEYAETRDATGMMSLFYIALKKKQMLIELWKLSTTFEKEKIVKFLRNDFEDKRWQLAANKNAYVLLGKHRYMDAAYFFLLAGSIKDCCMVLCSKVGDVPLGITVAKLYDPTFVAELVEGRLVKEAIEQNDRWTVSWIFWQQGLKEVAVQALIRKPQEMFPDIKATVAAGKLEHFLMDDPLLVILFNDLRSHKINYLQGAKQVDKLREFEFVVKVCTIYSRMGCDYLSILLLRNWQFESEQRVEPTVKAARRASIMVAPPQAVFEEPDMSSFDFGF